MHRHRLQSVHWHGVLRGGGREEGRMGGEEGRRGGEEGRKGGGGGIGGWRGGGIENEYAHIHVHIGCAVLLCLVCLFDLACFFLSSFSSLVYCKHAHNFIKKGSKSFPTQTCSYYSALTLR